MQHIGTPGDVNYLLRGLDHTTCRFRVEPNASHVFSTIEHEALSFVSNNPGATIRQMQASSSSLRALDHIEARTLVVGFVDMGPWRSQDKRH